MKRLLTLIGVTIFVNFVKGQEINNVTVNLLVKNGIAYFNIYNHGSRTLYVPENYIQEYSSGDTVIFGSTIIRPEINYNVLMCPKMVSAGAKKRISARVKQLDTNNIKHKKVFLLRIYTDDFARYKVRQKVKCNVYDFEEFEKKYSFLIQVIKDHSEPN